jgi:hypothetical protein
VNFNVVVLVDFFEQARQREWEAALAEDERESSVDLRDDEVSDDEDKSGHANGCNVEGDSGQGNVEEEFWELLTQARWRFSWSYEDGAFDSRKHA